jgi:hypothetical protein
MLILTLLMKGHHLVSKIAIPNLSKGVSTTTGGSTKYHLNTKPCPPLDFTNKVSLSWRIFNHLKKCSRTLFTLLHQTGEVVIEIVGSGMPKFSMFLPLLCYPNLQYPFWRLSLHLAYLCAQISASADFWLHQNWCSTVTQKLQSQIPIISSTMGKGCHFNTKP